MSTQMWWFAYLTVGVAVGAWLWHVDHDKVERGLSDLPLPPRGVVAAALTVIYGLAVVLWPLVVLVELYEWSRRTIDHVLYRVHRARCEECREDPS